MQNVNKFELTEQGVDNNLPSKGEKIANTIVKVTFGTLALVATTGCGGSGGGSSNQPTVVTDNALNVGEITPNKVDIPYGEILVATLPATDIDGISAHSCSVYNKATGELVVLNDADYTCEYDNDEVVFTIDTKKISLNLNENYTVMMNVTGVQKAGSTTNNSAEKSKTVDINVTQVDLSGPELNTAASSGDTTLVVGDSGSFTFVFNEDVLSTAEGSSMYALSSNSYVTIDSMTVNGNAVTVNYTGASAGTDTIELYNVTDKSPNYNVAEDPITQVVTVNAVNAVPVISNITSTGSISLGDNITNIGLDIADDDLTKVTWTLSVEGGTGTFSTSSGTGNTLSGITFYPDGGGVGWSIKATINDSGSGDSQTVTIYSN